MHTRHVALFLLLLVGCKGTTRAEPAARVTAALDDEEDAGPLPQLSPDCDLGNPIYRYLDAGRVVSCTRPGCDDGCGPPTDRCAVPSACYPAAGGSACACT